MISREMGGGGTPGLLVCLASLSSLHAARNFKGMAAGQVALLEYKVTLRDTLLCSTDISLCVSLGLASFGILFYERDTLLT